jgi:hypothetical protein
MIWTSGKIAKLRRTATQTTSEKQEKFQTSQIYQNWQHKLMGSAVSKDGNMRRDRKPRNKQRPETGRDSMKK